jgi:hypothetical protein
VLSRDRLIIECRSVSEAEDTVQDRGGCDSMPRRRTPISTKAFLGRVKPSWRRQEELSWPRVGGVDAGEPVDELESGWGAVPVSLECVGSGASEDRA